MTQFILAFFGLTALWLAMGDSTKGRKFAPIVGLLGQPWWLLETWGSKQYGMFALSIAYTLVYIRGAWKQWRPE